MTRHRLDPDVLWAVTGRFPWPRCRCGALAVAVAPGGLGEPPLAWCTACWSEPVMKPSSARPRLLRQETIGSCSLWYGDCRDALRRLKADGVLFDSVVCDPPYHLTDICRTIPTRMRRLIIGAILKSVDLWEKTGTGVTLHSSLILGN